MKILRAIIQFIIIMISIIYADNVFADWHVGNKRLSAYGVKANIWVPDSPIYLESSGESSWVSLPLPYWIQAGWRYYTSYPSPKSYIEWCTSEEYDNYNIDTLAWGNISEYKIDHYASTTWCASINGVLLECKIVRSAPSDVIANSEIHENWNNDLYTQFSAVYYKSTNGLWYLFDQYQWMEESPYYVEKYLPYYFRNYRGTTTYLPILQNP